MTRLSLSASSVILMACIALAGGGTMAVWLGSDHYVRERRAALDHNAHYAHALTQSVLLFLDRAVTTAETLAREAEAEPSLDYASLQPLVERFARQNGDAYVSMYVIGTDGVEIADFQPSGRDAAEQESGVGVDLNDRPYLRKVLEEKRPVISGAVIGRSTKRPVVVVAVPVLGKDGEVSAVAAGSLDLTRLRDLAYQAAADDELFPVVTDGDGLLVVHRDDRLVEILRDVSGMEPAHRALAGETGEVLRYTEIDGTELTAAYSSVPRYGWAVWVAEDVRSLEILVPFALRDALLTMLVVAVIVFAAFLAALWNHHREDVNRAEHPTES